MSSNDAESSTATSHRLPIAKITAVAKLKSFTESLSRREKRPSVVFPPPSWNLDDFNPSSTNEQPPPTTNDAQATDEPPASHADETVEPLTFAQKVRAMIETLPIPSTFVSSQTSTLPSENTNPGPDIRGGPGSPVPPGLDEDFVRMLSSEDLMNGDRDVNSKGKGRQSVWNILAGLSPSSSNDQKGKETAQETVSVVEEEKNGVMMYSTLEPSPNSEVRIAESETVLEYVEDPEDAKSATRDLQTESKDIKRSLPPKGSSGLKTIEKRVWVPSTTQLSVLTTWWGYRLYLPPPIMAKLGAGSIKATARAAMITGALKWLLDKIPLMLVPVQFRPAVSMLKRLSPVAGYVGVFIAWSWDRICTLDEGNGVVLTATWILPVALLPMSWNAGDIYGPRPRPKDQDAEHSVSSDKNEKKKSRFVW